MAAVSEQLPLLERLELNRCNPLTLRLVRRDTDLELAVALERNPFEGDLSGVAYDQRIPLAKAVKDVFAATKRTLLAARGLHDALFASLDRQNPLLPANRRSIPLIGSHVGKAIEKLPWSPQFAGGLVLSGWTGCGRSHVVDRVLSLFPQVVEHGHNEAAGWISLKQLVWLKVHMPADGSRGGLIMEMLMEIDAVLQTDYTQQFTGRSWTVEKQLVAVIFILSAHRCGLVVIEEAQEGNAGTASRFGAEFIRFFLRLLNANVAVAVVGNPLAFDELKSSAQNEARMTEFGWFEFTPTVDPSSPEWSSDLVPGIWKQSQLLTEPDEVIEDLEQLLLEKSGGVPRYLARLRTETLLVALRAGAPRVIRSHIVKASESSSMRGVEAQISALRTRNLASLKNWIDLPEDMAVAMWSTTRGNDGNSAETSTGDESNNSAVSLARSPRADGPKTARGKGVKAAAAVRDGYLSDEFVAGLAAALAKAESE
jgi:hypothetical protein